METISYETLLERMRETYRQESGCEAEEASDIGIRLRVLAGELYTLYRRLLWLEDQMYPQTAGNAFLDRHCGQRGISRKPAAKARGKLMFFRRTPLSYSVNIPEGTVCAAGDSMKYVTTAPCQIVHGTLWTDVEAEAEEGGSGYNCGPEAITTLISVPVGVEGVTNKAAFTGGMDEEDDSSLRQRLMDCCATFPDGANAAYYRELALQEEGVSSAGVARTDPGKITVYVWGTDGPPPQKATDALKELFAEKRELNTEVTVAPAEAYEYAFYADIKPDGCDIETARVQVETAMEEYFSHMKVGDPVLKSRLGEYLLSHCPLQNYRFPSSVTDYKGEASKIPVLSSVGVGELP